MSVLTAILEMLSDGMKIRLTSDSSPQEPRLLPPDLVRQRQVKGGSKSVMHNGMSLQCHGFRLFLSSVLRFSPIATSPVITYIYCSTHRQRTQNYIKTLESEVVRLRESETTLMQERDKLRNQVDNLKTTIIVSNIPLPDGIEDVGISSSPLRTTSPFDMPATVSYSNDALDHPRLHVNFPQRQDSISQAIDYPAQTYPLPSPYQGHRQYNNIPQSAPDLPNGWWSIPHHMNMTG